MIEMAHEGLPALQMRILENRGDIVELEVTVDHTGIGGQGDRGDKGTEEQVANGETIHGVVIPHRALMV